MADEGRTREQLIGELERLRQRNAELGESEAEHKRIEGRLKEIEGKCQTLLHDVLDSSNIGVFILDSDFKVAWINHAVENFFGLQREKVIGKDKRGLIRRQIKHVFEDPEYFVSKVFATYDNNSYIENFECHVLPSGKREDRWLEHWSQPIRSGLYAGGRMEHYTDITERKKMEMALRESEEKFRTFMETSSDLMHITDKDGNLTYVNESIARTMGYSKGELIGMHITQLLSEEASEDFKLRTEKLIKQGEFTYEPVWIAKEGREVYLETKVVAVYDGDGKLAGSRGISRDITERKKAEEALREREERYRGLFENMSSGVAVYEAVDNGEDFVFTGFNRAAEKIEHVNREDVIGKRVTEAFPGVKEFGVVKVFQRVWRTGKPEYLHEAMYRDKHDPGTWRENRVYKLTSGEIVAVYDDITERKQMEAERKEMEQKAQLASRLASIGEMASGIAHEINNPLVGVIGFAQLLMERDDLPEDARAQLEMVYDGGQRVASIVKGMLSFARQRKPERTYIDINQIVETTLKLRAYAMDTVSIKVVTRLDPELPWTMADAGQLQQVFLNIVMNAEKEMVLAHGRGKLAVKTEAIDKTIRISFKDDGPGIAKENLGKIFDPFFTTREVGQGTGLGLSVCHGIIAEHNGRIYAESKPGKETTFIVELPVISEEKQLEMAEPAAGETEKVAKARILVVDDEPTNLQYLNELLAQEGHEVETVDNGGDAIAMVNSKRYSLILLDIKMPGMSGVDFYNHFKKTIPSLASRIVFITGDVMGSDTMKFLSSIGAPYVTKPFDSKKLRGTINRLLTS